MPLTRHKISGQVAEQPQHLIDHPVLGKHLEVVPEGTKPFVPELMKADRSEDHKESEDRKESEGKSETRQLTEPTKTEAKDKK